ncbi:MAG: transcription elongation factor GreB [Bdellovibrionota bacterium]|nr:transcription elongation factor GreB [Bdellovibrionota bacterium]
MAKNYITPHGMRRLQSEYDYLKKKERPEVTRLVSWAASLGDRSENADYQYGKKRLREIDRRLRFLAKRIHDAVVVDPLNQLANTNGGEKIAFGATVTIEDEEGMARRIRIVGIDESDTTDGRISWKSPLGSSLLGKEVGDEIIVKAPAGEREYEVREIEYEEILIEEYIHVGPGESESR